MTRDEMDRVIDEHFAHEANRDVAGMLGTFTADGELEVVGLLPAPLRGQEQLRSYCEQLFAALITEDVHRLRRQYADDLMLDDVIWTGHFSDGWLFGAKGHSGRVRFRMLHVFEFEDRRIKRATLWIDALTAQQQLLAGGVGA